MLGNCYNKTVVYGNLWCASRERICRDFSESDGKLHTRSVENKNQTTRLSLTFIEGMLEGRSTHLKFDDHISNTIEINNGIGQGDPLSMVLYHHGFVSHRGVTVTGCAGAGAVLGLCTLA